MSYMLGRQRALIELAQRGVKTAAAALAANNAPLALRGPGGELALASGGGGGLMVPPGGGGGLMVPPGGGGGLALREAAGPLAMRPAVTPEMMPRDNFVGTRVAPQSAALPAHAPLALPPAASAAAPAGMSAGDIQAATKRLAGPTSPGWFDPGWRRNSLIGAGALGLGALGYGAYRHFNPEEESQGY